MAEAPRIPPAVGEVLGPLHIVVGVDRVQLYADASGDHNPIHVDPEFAARTDFGRPIVHGMLLLAYLSRLLSGRFGSAWPCTGTLDARFRAPAMVGATIVVHGLIEAVEPDQDGPRIACGLRCEDAEGQALVTATARLILRG